MIELCGKMYNRNKIDFVRIKKQKNGLNPLYYIVISYNNVEEVVESTKTIDELKIISKYNDIANVLKQDGKFFILDKFAPIINVKRVKNMQLKNSRILGYKNYLEIELYNGEVLKSKALPANNSINRNEYAYYLYCSAQCDQLSK